MKEFVANWKELLPAAGLAVLVILGIFFWMRRAPEDPGETERQRRAYLNRVGRIVEGQVLEIVDQTREPQVAGTSRGAKSGRAQKLLYYTYSISGVTYETAQDITGIEEQAHLGRVAAGQTASVKYDPSNPSNSILLADDWSGLN